VNGQAGSTAKRALKNITMKKQLSVQSELARALGRQTLLRNCPKAHEFLLAQELDIETIPAGEVLITEGESTKDVFLLVDGKFSVHIGGAQIGIREKGIHVGEMAMVMDSFRTATVTAIDEARVLRLSEGLMRQLLHECPEVWEPITETLCERLHARRLFFRQSNTIPKMFIGSSGKNRKVADLLAQELRLLLSAEAAQISVWTEDIFQQSDILISRLSEEAKISDFGAFIFAADDEIVINPRRKVGNTSSFTTRANVIFEAGMFVGACGLERTFIVQQKSPSMASLSDLGGVVYAEYSTGAGRAASLKKVAAKIADAITKKGVIRSTKKVVL
jgi:CRP-like cAMP-binding protein